jgi:hypothetical protein
MQIEILNPTFGRPDGRVTRGRVAFPKPTDRPLKVAFIDNEKPNTTRLLELVADGLRSRYPIDVEHLMKGGAAHPAPADIIDKASHADLVVLATAD